MVASTPGNKAEKDAGENLSLPGDGFDAVMRAKAAVEEACPAVVSCADILAITTRDLVGLVIYVYNFFLSFMYPSGKEPCFLY